MGRGEWKTGRTRWVYTKGIRRGHNKHGLGGAYPSSSSLTSVLVVRMIELLPTIPFSASQFCQISVRVRISSTPGHSRAGISGGKWGVHYTRCLMHKRAPREVR